jgi:hypothetical protein
MILTLCTILYARHYTQFCTISMLYFIQNVVYRPILLVGRRRKYIWFDGEGGGKSWFANFGLSLESIYEAR